MGATRAPTDEEGTAMRMTHEDRRVANAEPPGLSRPLKTALLMVALVGAFYLLREHWNHVAGNWVVLLLLACPLMHKFHGHGGHHGAGVGQRGKDQQGNAPAGRKE
jgi:hypothetical protein